MRLPLKGSPALRAGLLLTAVALAIGIEGCRQERHDPVLAPLYGDAYAPFTKGSYVEYKLDTLNANVLAVPSRDSGTVYERHVVRDTLSKKELYTSYYIDVYRRADNAGIWKLFRQDLAFKRFDGAVLYQRAGTQSQLLTLPFYRGIRWDLNAYNSQADKSAYDMRLTGFDADSVAQFGGIRDSNCLGSRLEHVGFKRGIGLVSRYSYEAEFIVDPEHPCAEPIRYQTRRIRQLTYLGSGSL